MRTSLAVCLALLLVVGCAGGSSTDGSTSSVATAAASSGVGGAATASSGAGGGAVGSSGAGGSGGSEACTPVALGPYLDVDSEPGGSSLVFGLTGLSATAEHVLFLEFFDVAGPQKAGTFALGAAPDDDYATCAHCALAFEDFSTSKPRPYFAESGTMTVTAPDAAFDGRSAGSLADVVLREVTIEGTTTTPVAGGGCLRLEQASWDTTSK